MDEYTVRCFDSESKAELSDEDLLKSVISNPVIDDIYYAIKARLRQPSES